MNENIKKRLAYLQKILGPSDQLVTIEHPDGSREKKSAREWWEHRKEWGLADFQHQDGGLVVLLMLAAMADDAGNTEERDDMLERYFHE